MSCASESRCRKNKYCCFLFYIIMLISLVIGCLDLRHKSIALLLNTRVCGGHFEFLIALLYF